jgi:hypothetical protein
MPIPRHLNPGAKRWFRAASALYELESHHFLLLTLAAEARDRCCGARRILDAEGTTLIDRHGQPRPRPEVAIERDSRSAFARLLRELNLDINPPIEPRRPPSLLSNRPFLDGGKAAVDFAPDPGYRAVRCRLCASGAMSLARGQEGRRARPRPPSRAGGHCRHAQRGLARRRRCSLQACSVLRCAVDEP